MPIPVKTSADLKPGDFYEDCAYHPCLCIKVDEDEVSGISLVDGSTGRGCTIGHCGIRRLTVDEALDWKFFGPTDAEVRDRVEKSARWWEQFSPQELGWYRPRRKADAAAT